jgi:probable blue pigment (indigoidine) exporter
MDKTKVILLTALVPCIWGSTYVITTELLPPDHALTNAVFRALPAGILLLMITRELPKPAWIGKLIVVGALNFSIFWWLLFEAAYRLPGGVAATVGAVQPLLVFGLSGWLLRTPVGWQAYLAGALGVVGVGLLALTPDASVDPVGISAALAGALSMALGVVLTKKWQFPASALSFATWQLIIGGFLLVPGAFIFETPLAPLTTQNLLGYLYLSMVGGALTYSIWFWGIARLGPMTPTTLGFFSPLSAMFLGWLVLSQTPTSTQLLGAALVLTSVVVGVWFQRTIIHPKVVSDPRFHGANYNADHSTQWRRDPYSHPLIQNMTQRQISDLPVEHDKISPD